MLPPLMLAVAFAFMPVAWVAAIWAFASIVLQRTLRFFMKHGPLTPADGRAPGSTRRPAAWRAAISAAARATLRGSLRLLFWRVPLTPGGWPAIGRHRDFSTSRLDYRHFEALRSDYWRITTAEALMIGRTAYGYVIWQKANPSRTAEAISPKLMPLLKWKGGHGGSHRAEQRAGVAALRHAGPGGDVHRVPGKAGQAVAGGPRGVRAAERSRPRSRPSGSGGQRARARSTSSSESAATRCRG